MKTHDDLNPYRSPLPAEDARVHWRLPFNTGTFVGRYLHVLATLEVVWMMIDPLFFSRVHFDPFFPFLYWGGSCLIRHSRTARKWVIGLSGLAIFAVLLQLAAYPWIVDTNEMRTTNTVFSLDRGIVSTLVGVAGELLLPVIPFIVLLTRQAKDEFTRKELAAGDCVDLPH